MNTTDRGITALLARRSTTPHASDDVLEQLIGLLCQELRALAHRLR